MLSSVLIQPDMGPVISLLATSPRCFRDLLRQGIQRWQMRQIAAHHDAATPLWPRGLRACVGGRRAAATGAGR
eukprot:7684030-Pyramimonas_sp.AAC.1